MIAIGIHSEVFLFIITESVDLWMSRSAVERTTAAATAI
jgi:hypothetical protein